MKLALKILFLFGVVLSLTGLVRIGYFQSKAILAQHLLNQAWQENQMLKQTSSTTTNLEKPWPWADTWPILKIRLPSLKLSRLVLKDTSGESLAFGPGLMTPQLQPGMKGNSFIAAHRDTHFKEIGQLKSGDKIVVENLQDVILTFSIDQIEIIDSRTHQASIVSDDKRITLVTCYPFEATEANTPFRYLVSAVFESETRNNLNKVKNLQSAETTLANLQR